MSVPLAIGTDIVEVARIQRACDRHGERFMARIYSPIELEYCRSLANPFPSLAARFAAKEAVSKAFGTGIGGEFGWLDAEVHLLESGAPVLQLSTAAKALMASRSASHALLSLSHTRELAQAMVVLC